MAPGFEPERILVAEYTKRVTWAVGSIKLDILCISVDFRSIFVHKSANTALKHPFPLISHFFCKKAEKSTFCPFLQK